MIEKYTPPNNKGKNDYRELLIIEGDSAAGTAKQGRFSADTQGMFSLRGVPLNSFDLTWQAALKNAEFAKFVDVLQCGIGKDFDINKCYFDKIILMSDSDSDGFRITSTFCAFIIKHMPQLVEHGKLYKVVAPLYRVDSGKKEKFLLSKTQFITEFERNIGDNVKLAHIDTGIILKKAEMERFLTINRLYLMELERLAKYYGVKREIVEFAVINFDPNNREAFIKKTKKVYPEMTLDEDNVFSGIHEGSFQNLMIDRFFFRRSENMAKLIELNGGEMYYQVHGKVGGKLVDRGVMSVGALMSMCQEYQPKIIARYKGLGELNPNHIKDTTLDPNNRILIQMTMEDLEEELRKFTIIHGDKGAADRKILMDNFKIPREELDN